MFALALLSLAHAGTKTCTYRGLPTTLTWDDAGHLRVLDGEDLLVEVDLELPSGTTSARCLPEGARFLTDTHAARGKLTLATRTVSLGSVLDTLDPARFERNRKREQEALTCSRTAVWDDYGDGWRVRALTSDVAAAGEPEVLQLSLLPSTTYRFSACVDASATDLTLQLVDLEGKVVQTAGGSGRSRTLTVESPAVATRFVVVRHDGASEAGISVAVGYR